MGAKNSKEFKPEIIVIPENQPIYGFRHCFDTKSGKLFAKLKVTNNEDKKESKEENSQPAQPQYYFLSKQEKWTIIETRLLKNLDKRLPEVFHFLEQVPSGCSYYHETLGWMNEHWILLYKTILPPRNIGEESLHRDFYKSSLKLAEHLKIVNLDYGYVLLNNEQTELLENILFGRKNSIIT
jgi:hypothetical protein